MIEGGVQEDGDQEEAGKIDLRAERISAARQNPAHSLRYE